MGKQVTALRVFNRGLISPLALARTDLDRTSISAEIMTNWMPRNLGSMMLRAGGQFIGATASNNVAKYIPFVFSQTDTALIEITDVLMRVWVNDILTTRASVTSAVTNGSFGSNVTSWDDKDEGGTAASVWVTGGYLGLTGDGTNAAVREQEVTTVETGTEHALDIVIQRGPVVLRVGSTTLEDDYINETVLGTGSHSLTFTPTGNFFIQFQNREKRIVLVESVAVGSSGVMAITAPWAEADLSKLRWDQSGDFLYIAADGYIQYKIIRRQSTGWSIEKYESEDGPFSDINITEITLVPAALSGNVTLTASKSLFKTTDIGSLFKVTSTGQTVSVTDIGAENTFTSAIKVTGVSTTRIFTIIREDRVDSTITLQRSLDSATSGFSEVTTYTTNGTIAFDDTLDNQTAWYRIGVATGDYGTDAIDLTLTIATGSIDGICRVTSFTDNKNVEVEVIRDFGGTTATNNWYPADWSTRKGYPTAVAFTEGRLGWGGRDKVWLSVSDAFESYDPDVIGDSGTIRRTIGSGPVDRANWMIGARRLLIGTDGSENSMRSSAEDEVLTPSNAMIKYFSTQGSATVKAAALDNNAIFVQKGGTRVFEASWGDNYDYQSNDLTTFYPEAGNSVITSLAIQRQPDTRVHCLRADGSVLILVHEAAENVSCWVKYTGGTVEDIVVLPGAIGSTEDSVYYIIKRTINSSTVRYLEKWALESECQGGATSKQMDSHVNGTVSGGVMTGLTHLEGESVVAWVNGKDAGSGTVSGGQVTGLTENGSGTVGLSYIGQWKSSKLSYGASPNQTTLGQAKNISQLGVILYNTHFQGLKYGPSFDELDDLPLIEDYTTTDSDTVHSAYDEESFEFDGRWDTDSRLCLQAQSPRPCTLLAAIIAIETNEKR